MHMIRKKRSDKGTLPVRPSLPTLEEIQADITNSLDDDFVFSSGEKFEDIELKPGISQTEINSEEKIVKPDVKQIAKVEEQYNKVLKFVKLHKSLIEGQKELNESTQGLDETCDIVQAERKALEEKLKEQQKLYQTIPDS